LLAKEAREIDLGAFCASAEEVGRREKQLTSYRQLAAEGGRSLTSLALEYVRGAEGVSVALLGVRNAPQMSGLLGQIAR
jgi:aryl-alcohol dehydrogenase-like predicted oxidoreductase